MPFWRRKAVPIVTQQQIVTPTNLSYGQAWSRLVKYKEWMRFEKQFTREQFCEGCEDDTCCICMDEFTPKQRLLVMPCKHRYHPHCLKSWMIGEGTSSHRGAKTCPMCKSEVKVGPRHDRRGDNGNSAVDIMYYIHAMKQSQIMVKHTYKHSKRVARKVMLSDDCEEIRWGNPTRSNSKLPSSCKLQSAKGVMFGPLTVTFQNRPKKRVDEDYYCFSLVMEQRTLDFSAPDDKTMEAWFLGLQYLIDPFQCAYYGKRRLLWEKAMMKIEQEMVKRRCTNFRNLIMTAARTAGQQRISDNAFQQQRLLIGGASSSVDGVGAENAPGGRKAAGQEVQEEAAANSRAEGSRSKTALPAANAQQAAASGTGIVSASAAAALRKSPGRTSPFLLEDMSADSGSSSTSSASSPAVPSASALPIALGPASYTSLELAVDRHGSAPADPVR